MIFNKAKIILVMLFSVFFTWVWWMQWCGFWYFVLKMLQVWISENKIQLFVQIGAQG